MFRSKISQLQDAILRDDADATLTLLKDPHLDIQFPNRVTNNLLIFAAKKRAKQTLQCLADHYHALNLPQRVGDQTHAIHFHAAAGHFFQVDSLLKDDPLLFFCACKKLYTPIELAAMAYEFDTVAGLISYDAFERGNASRGLKIITTLYGIITEYHASARRSATEILLILKILSWMQQHLLSMATRINVIYNLQQLHTLQHNLLEIYSLELSFLPTAQPPGSVKKSFSTHFLLEDEDNLGVNPNETQRLAQHANAFGFQLETIARDGNCLFAAIADQLNFHKTNPRQLTAADLRAMAVQHLSTHRKLYQDSIPGDFQTALNKAALAGTFGDHHHLLAIGRELGLQIVIFNSDQEMPSVALNVSKPNALICLGFEAGSNSHYHSLRQLAPNDIIKDLIGCTDIDAFFVTAKQPIDEADYCPLDESTPPARSQSPARF